MKERNSIAPKLRKGESLPNLPEGFVPIRVDGTIIGISAPEVHDSFVGKTGYTERQVRQMDMYRNRIRNLEEEQASAVDEVRSVLFQHRTDQIEDAQQIAIQADIFVQDEQKFVTFDDAMFVVDAYIRNAEFYRNVFRLQKESNQKK